MKIKFIFIYYIVESFILGIYVNIYFNIKPDLLIIIMSILMPFIIIFISKLQKEKQYKRDRLYLFEYCISSIIDFFLLITTVIIFFLIKRYTNADIRKMLNIILISVYLGKNYIYVSAGCIVMKYKYKKSDLILLKNTIYIVEIMLMFQDNIFLRIVSSLIYELDVISFIFNKKCFLDTVFKLEVFSVKNK